jgi:SET domain-containing protein
MAMYAARDILADEQLFWHYGIVEEGMEWYQPQETEVGKEQV